MDRKPTWGVFVAVGAAVAFTLVAGHLGKIADIFTGDLLYHLGVSRTMTDGSLQGSGPYEGLPSYFGGLFPMMLAVASVLGMRPETVLSVLSWFEPAMWVGAAVVVARSLWPDRAFARWAFVPLLLGSAGFATANDRVWVNAPNIVGQAWWPLFPRDVAILAALLAFAAAVRGRWVTAGVVSAIAVCTQAQVGAAGTALACSVLLLADWRRWRRAVASGLIALALSSWWWVPRLAWTHRWGLDLANRQTWVPLPITAGTVFESYGLLLIPAAVGCWALLLKRKSRGDTIVGLWFVASLVALAATFAVPDVLIAGRRALVLLTIPLAGVAAIGVEYIADHCRGQWRHIVAAAMVLGVIAGSVPAIHATRELVDRKLVASRFRVMEYPSSGWQPVWAAIASERGRVLVPSGDAVVAWMATGKPQISMQRPGPVKAGFPVGEATGWSEAQRRRVVTRAYTAGNWAMCRLLERRSIDEVLYRSKPDLLGVYDREPTRTDRELPDIWVPADHRVVIGTAGPQPIRAVSIWVANSALRERLRLSVGDGKSRRPTKVVKEAGGRRVDFVVQRRGESGSIVLDNLSNVGFRVIRVVGYAEVPGVKGPATLVKRADLCGARAGTPAHYAASWQGVWSKLLDSTGKTLVTPGDSDEAWQATGRPQVYPAAPDSANLHRFLTKERAWPADRRWSEIAAAFSGGSLCQLMTLRAIDHVLLRSRRDLIGVVDVVPRPGAGGWRSTSRVLGRNHAGLVDVGKKRLAEVSVWVAGRQGEQPALRLVADGGAPRGPSAMVVEQNSIRFDFIVPRAGRGGTLTLLNGSTRPWDILRTVGFARSAGAHGPATLVDRDDVCEAHR